MLQRPRLSRRDFPDCRRLADAIGRELGAAPRPPGRPIAMTMPVLSFVVDSLGGMARRFAARFSFGSFAAQLGR
jgi:hypothetical protein